MSATTASAPRSAGVRLRLAAVLILIGLAGLAYYAMFSGPTTVPLPVAPKAAPSKAPAPAGESEPSEGGGVTEPDPANYPWWLASRSAGIVAFLLIAASVTLGLFMASGIWRRPGMKRDLLKVHQYLALSGLTMIAVHGLCLLGDKWLNPGIVGIAVPFTISYRPLWVGLGIVGGYLAALLGPTYFVRRRIGTRRWRLLHRATVAVYVLAVAHSLGSGTDGASTWFTVMVALTALPILALLAIRYRPRRSSRVSGTRPEPLAPAAGVAGPGRT